MGLLPRLSSISKGKPPLSPPPHLQRCFVEFLDMNETRNTWEQTSYMQVTHFLSPVISFVFDWRYGYISKSNGTNSFLMRLCTESDWNGILLCSTSLSNMDIPKSCLRIQITKKMIRLKARYSITNLTISIRLHYWTWTERRE